MSFKFSLTYIGVLDEDFNFLPWLEKKKNQDVLFKVKIC